MAAIYQNSIDRGMNAMFARNFKAATAPAALRKRQEGTEDEHERDVVCTKTSEGEMNEGEGGEDASLTLTSSEEEMHPPHPLKEGTGCIPQVFVADKQEVLNTTIDTTSVSTSSVQDEQGLHPFGAGEEHEVENKKILFLSMPPEEDLTNPQHPTDQVPRPPTQVEDKTAECTEGAVLNTTADTTSVSMTSIQDEEDLRENNEKNEVVPSLSVSSPEEEDHQVSVVQVPEPLHQVESDVGNIDKPFARSSPAISPTEQKKAGSTSREDEELSTVASSLPSSSHDDQDAPILIPISSPRALTTTQEKEASMPDPIVPSKIQQEVQPRPVAASAAARTHEKKNRHSFSFALPGSPIPDDQQSVSSLESLASFHTSGDGSQPPLQAEDSDSLSSGKRRKKHQQVTMAKWLSSISHVVQNKRSHHAYEHHRRVSAPARSTTAPIVESYHAYEHRRVSAPTSAPTPAPIVEEDDDDLSVYSA